MEAGHHAPIAFQRRRSIQAGLTVIAVVLLSSGAAKAQVQVGNKVLGTLGLDAGVQPAPGVYIVDQVLFYAADSVAGGDGQPVPLPGLDIDAVGNVIGASGTFAIPHLGYWTGAAAVPYARITIDSDDPRASVDRFGFGDLYLSPIKLGWHLPRFDIVTGYSLYVPTGHFEPMGGTGIGRGFWTNEFSTGGTAWLTASKSWRLSALASFDLNGKKRGIDIKRGDTLQVQGGLGVRLRPVVDLGVAGYALWQVSDDEGADLPPALRGLRARTFGAGPEVDLALPWIRARLVARYEWDFLVRAGPQGRILVVNLAFAAWRPAPPS